MPYTLDRRLFLEDGPAIKAANIVSARNFAALRSWRRLDFDRRLDVVERALATPANDPADGFPIAL